METAALLSFALASLIIELTPGPNMTYLAVVAASEGRSRGFAAVAGVAVGLSVLGLAAASGLSQIIVQSRLVYEVLRWIGVAYLLYLAWEGWRGEGDIANAERSGHASYFLRGLITNILNPKAALFYIAVLPTFISAESPLLAQMTLLSLVYVTVATAVHSAIILMAGSFATVGKKPGREITARRILSLMLVAIALWMAYATAR